MIRFFQRLKKQHAHEIDPYPIRDTAVFRNTEETLTLKVSGDPSVMVVNLNKAQARLSALNDQSSEEEQREAVLFFAESIFGKEQAAALMDFYGDPLIVMTACGRYFQDYLSGIIIRAQTKG